MSRTRLTTLSLALVLLLAAVAPAATAATTADAAIDADAVGDLTATAAPGALSASAAAEATTQSSVATDSVAESDVAVLRLNASGTVDADGDGEVLGDELLFELRQTEETTGPSHTNKVLDVAASGNATAVTTTEDAVFVAVDLSNATFDRASGETTAAAGDAFRATATLTGAATDGANVTRNTTFSVVEPAVAFEDDPSEAPAGEIAEFDVTTTLAPGTSLLFEVAETGAESGLTAQTTVRADGTATVPLSFFTFEAGQEYTITASAEGVAALNESWTGEAVGSATATAGAETDATATDSTESEGQPATTTDDEETTSTDGPGFGVGAAVLALAGAALVAGRRA